MEDSRISEDLRYFLDFSLQVIIGVFQMYGHNIARKHFKLIKISINDFSRLQIEVFFFKFSIKNL